MVNPLSIWSRLGRLKFLLILIAVCGVAGLAFLYYQHRASSLPTDGRITSRYKFPKPRHEMHGFRFDGTQEGKRTMSITADRFVIEKKKLGFLRFGLINVARLTNVDIDIYGKTTGTSDSETYKDRDLTFKHVFSKKALQSFPAKRISSIVMEPVSLKLHDEKSVVAQVSAHSATIRSRRGEVLFEGSVRVVSGSRELTTEQLVLVPENAVLRTDRSFVLKTPEKQFKGERLTTDIYLSPNPDKPEQKTKTITKTRKYENTKN